MLGVEGDYEFIALDVSSGEVVHGVSPEFEDVLVVDSCFTEFLIRLTTTVGDAADVMDPFK